MDDSFPVFGICGYSGSGKTTLIEALVPKLCARNLKVAVVKHDCHGLSVDRKGKDSDRFFEAGADVVAQGPGQGMFRTHTASVSLQHVLRLLCSCYDLVLVEGHKTSPLARKIWLLNDGEGGAPSEAGKIRCVLARGIDRIRVVGEWIDEELPRVWRRTPVYAGVLTGGKASRMGRPKHLLEMGGKTWLEHLVRTVEPFVEQTVLLGAGQVPAPLVKLTVVPDAPGVEGPLAGMLAALRWQPFASWLFAACDLPLMSAEAVQWLLATRRPGVWATVPRLDGRTGVEPLLAHYDFRCRHLLEQCACPSEVIRWDRVATPVVPRELAASWRNINTAAELRALVRLQKL